MAPSGQSAGPQRPYPSEVRWDRLFDDLEGQVEHEHARERDALVDELREGEWSQICWVDLMLAGSDVEVVVRDVGAVRGSLRFANRQVLQVESAGTEHVIATTAVVWASGERRPTASASALQSLGWGHVLRSSSDDVLRFRLCGGHSVDGRVDVVGADFVRVTTGADGQAHANRLLPFSAIRMVTVLT